ncbi:MAG: tetratricopeptide repeat protein, partial [Thaumarchaeota archaeon]|nr:tetratricopeptide repeat protein [Nitrososphaerota archaeon]
ECCNTAIRLDPEYDVAYVSKGETLHAMEKYDDAIECFNTAIRLDPEYIMAYAKKVLTLLALDKYDDALKCYDMMVTLDPDNPVLSHVKIEIDIYNEQDTKHKGYI